MKWVYGFDEADAAQEHVGGDWERVRDLLGGKGANLALMTRLGIPVPPGFSITTEACTAYLEHEAFPDGLWDQVLEALARVEEQSGRAFGDPDRPLLVSCRSGAKFSMPGMMDTVLDIGLNDEVAAGMVALTGDEHMVQDSYRRLVQMFGAVVLGVRDEPFEDVLASHRAARGVTSDADLPVEDLREIVGEFKRIVRRRAGVEFPDDPTEQLRMAIEAVFRSWNGKRARDYREASGIPHDLGTAVNVQTMVFGNVGDDSATGVAMSRNATTGEPHLEGDYLINAQGEDVVAGIRPTKPIAQLAEEMPEIHAEFAAIAQRLERHFRDMQDMEFTVERGKLWVLQTRVGKRTAQAAVRIAVDLAEEGLISREEALDRVTPEQVDAFLHPQVAPGAREGVEPIAKGLDVSPGAAVGVAAFDADRAEEWGAEGRDVILVRRETRPDDVHGLLAAKGVLTSAGGRTSHAALVARQFGRPAVVGAEAVHVDLARRRLVVGDVEVAEGEWLTVDGNSGEVFAGQLETVVPDVEDPWLTRLLDWADDVRRLGVRANADHGPDAERARAYGAEGIGLCRTEHMFFAPDRLPIVQKLILADDEEDRRVLIDSLAPLQRGDFVELFRAMDGQPVVIRLLDPPLHEFLPSFEELTRRIADLQIRLTSAGDLDTVEELLADLRTQRDLLDRVSDLREQNPMLGRRGVRLGLHMPDLGRMQARAIFEAAADVAEEGMAVRPEVMVPLTSHVEELRRQADIVRAEAEAVLDERDVEVEWSIGTMIEVPRACVTAGAIAEVAAFLSFGTNDLTQTTFGMSRDDAESGFLVEYLDQGILPANPFATLDEDGVGALVAQAVDGARAARPGIEAGICGEHGGDPASIALCDRIGLDYVSCSPFRVPVARLAAAQSALALARERGEGGGAVEATDDAEPAAPAEAATA